MATDQRFRQWWSRMLRSSASPSAALALLRMNAEIDIRQILPSIRVPTLLLHSVNDHQFDIGTSRYVVDRIPRARLIELSGQDHIPTEDDSGAILDAIEEFVTGARHSAEHDRVLATVLFSDIVNSTQHAAALGDRRWTDLLARHHALVRRELTRFRGREIDTTGDGFLAAFDGPARGVRCACAISSSVRSLGIEVRAGLHTGENARSSDTNSAGFASTWERAGVQPHHAKRLRMLLVALDTAKSIDDMDIPGFRLHPLKAEERGRWSVWVNGNWRVTFEFKDGHALVLDYEDDH